MAWPKNNPAAICIVLLVAMVLFGGWLRFRQAGDSLWLDELHTAWVTEASGGELAERAATGNQSPLYFYGVAAISRLLGPSEVSLRLLSLLAGSTLPIVIWGLGRRLLAWDGQAGGLQYVPLLAAWLAAVDPATVFYAQEARPYACVQLLVVVHVWLLVALLDEPTRLKRLAWVACGGLLFYLHYTAALIIVAEVCFVCLWLIYDRWQTGQLDRPQLARFVVDALCLVLLTLPALPPLLEIYERRRNWALFVDRVGLTELAELTWMIPWSAWALIYPLFSLIAFATSNPVFRRESARMRERGLADGTSTHRAAAHTQWAAYSAEAAAPSVWLLLCWLAIPIAIVALTSAADWLRLWHVRYLIGVTPAAFLLAGMIPRLASQRLGIVVAIAIALYASWSSHASLDWFDRHGRPQRSENWRAAVQYLNTQAGQQPILVRSGLIEADALRASKNERLADYCRFPLTALYRVERPKSEIHPLTMTEAGRLTDALRKELQPEPEEAGTVWLVVRGDAERADLVVRELQQTFAPQATTVNTASQESFGRVQVRKLVLTARL